MQKQATDQRGELQKDVKTQHGKEQAAAAKTAGEVEKRKAEVEDQARNIGDGIKRQVDEIEAAAKGGYDPEKVNKTRDDAKKKVEDKVVRWRGIYKRMGERRVEQIEKGHGKQRSAYEAAAEIDRRQFDFELGVKVPSARDKTKKEYVATDKWLEDQLKELKDAVYDPQLGLMFKAQGERRGPRVHGGHGDRRRRRRPPDRRLGEGAPRPGEELLGEAEGVVERAVGRQDDQGRQGLGGRRGQRQQRQLAEGHALD
jgi:hypothetical protein